MRIKKRLVSRLQPRSLYLKRTDVEFVSTGCTLLNLIIGGGQGEHGGGWPLGRISNIIGDRSTGKTLLAIEAMANFYRTFPDGEMWYDEYEAAFDKSYAATLGLPLESPNLYFPNDSESLAGDTVEALFDNLEGLCDSRIANEVDSPLLYIVDSVDAMTDTAEKGRKIGEGTYATNKAKQLGQLFRRLTRKMKIAKVTLLLISQVRDRIDAGFGRKWTRSGGKAIDFYASLILYLAETGKEYRTFKGIKRPIGVNIKAFCDKNKVAQPFRQCSVPLIFNYGMDDIDSCITFLEKEAKETGILKELGLTSKTGKVTAARINTLYDSDKDMAEVRAEVIRVWKEIEKEFLPKRRKYYN